MCKVYVAGGYPDRAQVKEIHEKLRECGHTITCDWTDRTDEGVTDEDKPTRAVECVEGVRECNVMIAIASLPTFIKDRPKADTASMLAQLITHFMNPERHQGEVMAVVGGALVMNKPVLLMGAAGYESVMLQHPNVKRVENTEDAIKEVNSLDAGLRFNQCKRTGVATTFMELVRNSDEATQKLKEARDKLKELIRLEGPTG